MINIGKKYLFDHVWSFSVCKWCIYPCLLKVFEVWRLYLYIFFIFICTHLYYYDSSWKCIANDVEIIFHSNWNLLMSFQRERRFNGWVYAGCMHMCYVALALWWGLIFLHYYLFCWLLVGVLNDPTGFYQIVNYFARGHCPRDGCSCSCGYGRADLCTPMYVAMYILFLYIDTSCSRGDSLYLSLLDTGRHYHRNFLHWIYL